MILPQIVKVMMGQANVNGERSTALHAILWLIAIICALFSVIAFSNIGVTFLYIILCIFCVALLFFGYVFLFCLKNNPDLLRSEKYALQKMTIENSIHGDSEVGILESKPSKHRALSKKATISELGSEQEDES